MGRFGLFDADERLAALKRDPLEAIDRLVPWESFRANIEAVLTPDEMRKSSAGRKPLDAIVMFRMLVLQALDNLTSRWGIRCVIGCRSPRAGSSVASRTLLEPFIEFSVSPHIPNSRARRCRPPQNRRASVLNSCQSETTNSTVMNPDRYFCSASAGDVRTSFAWKRWL